MAGTYYYSHMEISCGTLKVFETTKSNGELIKNLVDMDTITKRINEHEHVEWRIIRRGENKGIDNICNNNFESTKERIINNKNIRKAIELSKDNKEYIFLIFIRCINNAEEFIYNISMKNCEYSQYSGEQSIELDIPDFVNHVMEDAINKKFKKVKLRGGAIDSTKRTFAESQCEEVDLSDLNMYNIDKLEHTFINCKRLKKITFGKKNNGEIKSFTAMINGCTSLEELDIRNVQVSNGASAFEFNRWKKDAVEPNPSVFKIITSKINNEQVINVAKKEIDNGYSVLHVDSGEEQSSITRKINRINAIKGSNKVIVIENIDKWGISKCKDT